jgi:hypothetical protein
MRPEVTKNQSCFKCGTATQQQLIPSELGCDWQCTICKQTAAAYTLAEMAVQVQKHVFGVVAPPVDPPEIPTDYKVFLKCEFESNVTPEKEMEASPAAVKAHVNATGKLPQIGKSLFASVHGALVPYGEVVRIQNGINK